jgi:hypothetical protein
MRIAMAGVALCLGLLTASGSAQSPSSIAREPGKIWPWVYNHIADAVANERATPADLKAVEAHLLEIVGLLKATPMLNPPMGFEVRYTGTLMDPDPDYVKRITAMRYWLEFAFMDYLNPANPPGHRGVFPNRGLNFFINDLDRLATGSTDSRLSFTERSWTDTEGQIWIEPPSDELGGLRFYRIHDALAVTRNGAAAWRPVKVGRFLPLYLTDKKKGASSAEGRLATAKRAYDEVTSAGAEARHQKEIEAARSGKNADMEVRRLELIRRRRIEDAKAEMTLNPSNPKHQWYYAPKRALADAEALAASLDEAGRQALACIAGNTWGKDAWESRLVPDGTAGCHRIVRPNLGLFDNTLPRTAMQLIVVTGIASCERDLKSSIGKQELLYPGGCGGTVKLAGQFDWQKLAALLGR